MGLWRLEEARLVQERSNVTVANAEELLLGYPGCPEGKAWVVLGCAYIPSVNETQVVSFEKYTRAGSAVSLLNPISINLNPGYATFIEQGMEYLLLPGEWIRVRRYAHTLASTMSGVLQIIEIDLPLYTYDEPQTVKRITRAVSSIRQRIGGSPGARGGGGIISPVGHGSTGGGGGGALPV